ncbi:DHH family phosphoesterase [Thermovirga lienii]|jgi:phosphoesterase RecJ-like protein|uniref:DHH family phosphoesterase n=1 Tax=Thermovirga lienii TaxID=336261 RepID=UPI0007464966|nr:MAG: Phosphoesterase RecJ domain protein [Thermovirga lienii]MDN5318391.1 bifunctional oligoribonuclease and phosphatase NrnA [Thermovirga sp.]MDN5367940.1 bifunctional oligoribonuclease and phosphatase NrnA [Thermovirga sp.]HCD71148.1 hypothetical protein [Thermovirga lienii]
MREPFASIREALLNARCWLVLAHEKPDGDSLGCGSALVRRAEVLNKDVIWCGPDEIPEMYAFLYGIERYKVLESVEVPKDSVVVAIDIASLGRTTELLAGENSEDVLIVNIDHHGDNTCYGAINLVREEASSVAEIIWLMYNEFGWEVFSEEALGLYVALATDSGHFRFSNTSSQTHAVAAELLRIGELDPQKIFTQIYENRPIRKMRLWGKAFIKAELHLSGRLCVCCLTNGDFEECGAKKEDTEHLVNEFLSIKDVMTAVLLVEDENGTKASIRTREPVDAREIARIWSGGGHVRAAGCRIEVPVEEAKELILKEIGAIYAERGYLIK